MSHPSHNRYSLTGQTRLAYEKCLIREGIPSKRHPFYCVRANQFIKEGGNRDPDKLEVNKISEILVILGRDENLSDWQFVQLVDAVPFY